MARNDDYDQQMKAAADREAARTGAEGNCIVRTKGGELCRRPVAKDLLAKGIPKCRVHIAVSTRGPAKP